MNTIPFREMRHRLNTVIWITTNMASLPEFPEDTLYHAYLFGLLAATPKQGRGLTRVQHAARIIVWIDHFNKGLDKLWTLHAMQPDLQKAKRQFAEWEQELRG